MGLTEKLNDTSAQVRKCPPKVPRVRQNFARRRSHLLVAICPDVHLPNLRGRPELSGSGYCLREGRGWLTSLRRCLHQDPKAAIATTSANPSSRRELLSLSNL
jgi:hypothetical protein